jgi:hypothetical protein
MDMRKEIRYRLEAPAVFTWENFEHKRLQGEGITRDISLLGAFILSATCPPRRTSIRVELALPSVVGIEADIRIIGEAHVVRVQHSNGRHGENGFAVVPFDLHNWSLLTYKHGSLYQREIIAPAIMNFR